MVVVATIVASGCARTAHSTVVDSRWSVRNAQTRVSEPTTAASTSPGRKIACDRYECCVLHADGTNRCAPTEQLRSRAKPALRSRATSIRDIAAIADGVCELSDANILRCSLRSACPRLQASDGVWTCSERLLTLRDVQAIATLSDSICALRTSGQITCVGEATRPLQTAAVAELRFQAGTLHLLPDAVCVASRDRVDCAQQRSQTLAGEPVIYHATLDEPAELFLPTSSVYGTSDWCIVSQDGAIRCHASGAYMDDGLEEVARVSRRSTDVVSIVSSGGNSACFAVGLTRRYCIGAPLLGWEAEESVDAAGAVRELAAASQVRMITPVPESTLVCELYADGAVWCRDAHDLRPPGISAQTGDGVPSVGSTVGRAMLASASAGSTAAGGFSSREE